MHIKLYLRSSTGTGSISCPGSSVMTDSIPFPAGYWSRENKLDKLKKTTVQIARELFVSNVEFRGTQDTGDRNDVLVGELIERKMWTRCYHCGHSVE
ncbi:hypothetical protein Tsubulata_041933, partial [Turnera subulata]